jgi:hypothetical protein
VSKATSHLRAAAAAGAVAGYLALQWLGRSYGATRTERHRRLPGDDLMAAPMAVTTHAITIDAPPERIWPWLVQMGWHRGAWYTAQWVDRLLFPANGPSADHIISEFLSGRLPGTQGTLPGHPGPKNAHHESGEDRVDPSAIASHGGQLGA